MNSCVAVCGGTAESFTRTVNLNVPAAKGVPLKMPAELKRSPGGKSPRTTDHVYGVDPPLADTACA